MPEFQSPSTLFYFTAFFTGMKIPEGEEHRQIIGFYPPTFSRQDRIKHTGLAQAIINFSKYAMFKTWLKPELSRFDKNVR